MADGLQALGIAAEPAADGMRVAGAGYGGGIVDSPTDHRVAMAFAIATLRAGAPLAITDCANVSTSFPGFVSLARAAGLRISETRI